MKTSVLKLLFTALPLFFVGQIFSQNKVDQTLADLKNGHLEPPENRAADLTDLMKSNLELTDEQAAKVQEINLRFSERTEREIVQPNLGQWSKYWKLMALQREKDKELEPVLTKTQFKKYADARDAAIWKGMKTLLF